MHNQRKQQGYAKHCNFADIVYCSPSAAVAVPIFAFEGPLPFAVASNENNGTADVVDLQTRSQQLKQQ
jgi:hypothetical protein